MTTLESKLSTWLDKQADIMKTKGYDQKIVDKVISTLDVLVENKELSASRAVELQVEFFKKL